MAFLNVVEGLVDALAAVTMQQSIRQATAEKARQEKEYGDMTKRYFDEVEARKERAKPKSIGSDGNALQFEDDVIEAPKGAGSAPPLLQPGGVPEALEPSTPEPSKDPEWDKLVRDINSKRPDSSGPFHPRLPGDWDPFQLRKQREQDFDYDEKLVIPEKEPNLV